jgi:Uma2 family endonuclease
MKDVLDIPRTAMEVFEMLPEGALCEVIDNVLYMSPSPSTDHQDLLGDIFFEIRAKCKALQLGKVYLSPCDVYLDNGENVVQPDILFINADRIDIIEKKGIMGPPDFVIEILSANIKLDTEMKLALYQRNLIPEYFIIDPSTKKVLHYLLTDNAYNLQTDAAPGVLNILQLKLQINF